MSKSIEERIESLLDQLTNPGTSASEVKLIESKLEVLRAQQE